MLMRTLRRQTKPIMWGVLILISFSFILAYGTKGWLAGPEEFPEAAALTVDGQIIPMRVFTQNYQARLEQMQQQERERWRSTLPRERQVAQGVRDALVDSRLQARKAEKLGIQVTPAELQDYIRKPFDDAGVPFNLPNYRYFVEGQLRMPLEAYEAQQREQLAMQKLRGVIRNAYFVTEPEVRREYERRNTKYRLEYLYYLTSEFMPEVKDEPIDEKALTESFEKHREDYKIPESVQLRYVHLRVDDFRDQVVVLDRELEDYLSKNAQRFEVPASASLEAVLVSAQPYSATIEPTSTELTNYFSMHSTDFAVPGLSRVRYTYIPVTPGSDSKAVSRKDIETYYERHSDRYEVKREQARVRDILVALAPNAAPWKKEEALAKIQRIRETLEEGLSFAEAARDFSEDEQTAEKGGDLGWIARGGMQSPELMRAAFSLEIGQVSQPFRDGRGYHLVMVEDRADERTRTLEEEEENILKMLASEALERLRYAALDQGLNPEILGATHPVRETALFPHDATSIDPIIGEDAPAFVRAVSSLHAGEVSRSITGEGNFYLAEVLEATEERPADFEEVKDRVRQAYVQQRSLAEARDQAALLKKRMQEEGLSLPEVAEEIASDFISTGTIERTSELPVFGDPLTDLMDIVFGETTEGETSEGMAPGRIEVIGTDRGAWLVRLASFEEAHVPPLEAVRDQVESAVRTEKAPERAKYVGQEILDTLRENRGELVDAEDELKAYRKRLEKAGKKSDKEKIRDDIRKTEADIAELKKLDRSLAEAPRIAVEEIKISPDLLRCGTTEHLNKTSWPEITGWDGGITQAGLALYRPDELIHSPVASFHGRDAYEATDYFLLELLERVEEATPETLEPVREQVEEDYRWHLAAEHARKEAENAYARIQEAIGSGELVDATGGLSLLAFANRIDAPYYTNEDPQTITYPRAVFPRSQQPANLVRSLEKLQPGIISAPIPSLERNARAPESPARINGFYILRILEKEEPDWEAYEDQSENIRLQLANRQVQSVLMSWSNSLRETADIVHSDYVKYVLADERGEEIEPEEEEKE